MNPWLLAEFVFLAGQALGWAMYLEDTVDREETVWDACLAKEHES